MWPLPVTSRKSCCRARTHRYKTFLTGTVDDRMRVTSFSDTKYKNPENRGYNGLLDGQDYKSSRTGRKQGVDVRKGVGTRPNTGQEKCDGAG